LDFLVDVGRGVLVREGVWVNARVLVGAKEGVFVTGWNGVRVAFLGTALLMAALVKVEETSVDIIRGLAVKTGTPAMVVIQPRLIRPNNPNKRCFKRIGVLQESYGDEIAGAEAGGAGGDFYQSIRTNQGED